MNDPPAARGWLPGAILLGIGALHTAQTWGHWGLYWGDPGQVLHQLERFAAGEALYRDVFVTSPPLGYWVVGSGARLVGTDPGEISFVTGAIFIGLVMAWWRWVRRTLTDSIDRWLAPIALVLAAALACALGVALPLGSYAPGGPVGFTCLLLALLASDAAQPRALPLGNALAAGIFCGGCVLAKQDFWAPALYVAVSVFARALRERNVSAALGVAAASALTVFTGAARVAADAGWTSLPRVATGYGVAGESGFGRSAPSWERLSLEGIGIACIALAISICVLLAGSASRRWRRVAWVAAGSALALTCVRVAAAAGFDAPPLNEWPPQLASELRALLFSALPRHPLPTLLPVAVGVLLLSKRRNGDARAIDRALWLIGLCVAARTRRGFELTEWFQVLLELPTYAIAARALAPTTWLAPARIALVALALVAAWSWWTLGHGALSSGGRLRGFASERGFVHLPPKQIESYERLRDALDARDPGRTRPVFAFGHSGGIAYWLRRENPTPLTYGFSFAPIPPAEAVARLRRADPPVFLVYSAAYEHIRIQTTDRLVTRWRPATRLNTFMARDLAWFEKARVGCEEVAMHGGVGKRKLRMFDCASLSAPR